MLGFEGCHRPYQAAHLSRSSREAHPQRSLSERLCRCVDAVQALTRGTNTGKTMVKLAAPSNPAYRCS